MIATTTQIGLLIGAVTIAVAVTVWSVVYRAGQIRMRTIETAEGIYTIRCSPKREFDLLAGTKGHNAVSGPWTVSVTGPSVVRRGLQETEHFDSYFTAAARVRAIERELRNASA